MAQKRGTPPDKSGPWAELKTELEEVTMALSIIKRRALAGSKMARGLGENHLARQLNALSIEAGESKETLDGAAENVDRKHGEEWRKTW
jgi:hypothetical protein